MMKKLLLLPLFFSFIFNVSSITPSKDWNKEFGQERSFIENKGQYNVRNPFLVDKDIRFSYDEQQKQIHFTPSGVIYHFYDMEKNPNRPKGNRTMPRYLSEQDIIAFEWVGANKNVQIEAHEKQPFYSNFSTYDGRKEKVKSFEKLNNFKKIIYKNLYNGIDVVYEIHPQQDIKYSLVVKAGADISQVKMRYSNDRQLMITSDGKLAISTKFGDIVEQAPLSFYTSNQKSTISSGFVLQNNEVSFQLSNFDKTKNITIDPWVQTPNFNTGWKCVWECETDAAGNSYLIGGVMPMQLLKYNTAGVLQWTYTTPYDTSNTWLGNFATDNAGNSYVTEGTGGGTQRISTAGALVWNRTGNPGGILTEFWSIAFNCDQTGLVIGGTGGTGITPTPYMYNMNPANGSVTATRAVTGGALFPTQEVRAVTACGNGNYYFLSHDSIGYIHQGLTSCLPSGSFPFHVSNGYGMGYKCENWRRDNSGIAAMKYHEGFVYTHRGDRLDKRAFATAAIVQSVAIPGGQWGSSQVRCSGIDIDDCGNIYVGATNGVVKFNTNLVQQATYSTSFVVYDVAVGTGGEITAAGSTGTSSSGNRTGSIQSISASACTKYAAICCDATVCQVPQRCTTDPAVTLTPTTPGGTFSGPGVSGNTFNPAVAGVGTHTIRYTLACGSDSIRIVVNSCTATSVCRETNGNLTVSGGTGPYTWFRWQPAQTTTVTNAATCTQCGGTWTPFVNQCLNGILPVTSCTTPAQWVQFGTGATVTPPVGVDSVRVVDNAGTGLVVQITTVPSCNPVCNLSLAVTRSLTQCQGNNGTITITPSGGTTPYSYVWSPNVSSTNTATGLSAGTYRVTVNAGSGCSRDTTITLTAPNAPQIQWDSVWHEVCLGQNNGGIRISAVASALYSLFRAPLSNPSNETNNGTNNNFLNLAPGTYIIGIRDNNGCVDTIIRTVNPGINCCNITFTKDSTQPSCANPNGGLVRVNVTPQAGSTFSYAWSPVSGSTNTLSNLSAGTYTVTITQNSTGGSTVKDTIFYETFNSGTSNWTLNTGSGTNQWVVNSVYPGGACSLFGLPLFTIPDVPNQPVAVAGNPTSNYLHIRATTNPSGCGAPFPPLNANYDDQATTLQYTEMTNNVSTLNRTNVAFSFWWVCAGSATNYGFVQYSTNNGGTWTTVGTNLQGNASSWTYASITNPAFDNQAQIRFRFAWTNGTGGADPAVSIDDVRIVGDNTSGGGSSCSRVTSFTLTNPVTPNITSVSTSAEVCLGQNNGQLNSATTTGGTGQLTYSYAPSSNPLTITPISSFPVSNLSPGTYILGVQDVNNCRDTFWFTIGAGPNCCNLAFQSIAITQPTCGQSNGSISLTMTGGTLPYSYTWSPNVSTTNVASNLAPNTYNVTVNAGVGCSRDTVITLNSNSNLAINISNVVNPTCVGSNGSLTAGFSGGTAPYTVTIDTVGTPIVFSGIPFPVSQPVNSLPADTIRIRVTDGQNCEANQIVVLSSPSPPTINNIQVANEQCLNAADGQLIAANATGGSGGGYSYSYSPSANPTNTTPIVSFPVTNLAAGSYILTVVDGAGCRDTAWFSIVAGPLCCNLTLSAALTQPDCGINNGAINVTVTQGSGNYTYAWQPGGQSTEDVSNLSAGNYNLTLTDVTQGCSIDTIFSLSNPNAPTINNVQVTNERCTGDNNGSITVTASGGTGQLNYTWSPSLPNSASQSNLSPGPYSFTITDANNCVVTGSRTILAGTRPDASGVVTNPSCNNNDGQITISVLPIGSYQYVLSNGAQNGSGQFSTLPQGPYQVFVIDGNGCRDTVGLNLVASGPILSTISSQNVSCFGANDGSIVLNNVLPNYQYSWSVQGLQGSSLLGLAPNTYSVTITDGLGCSLVLSTVISSPSPVIVSLGQDTVFCGTSFRINAGNPGLTFAWSTNEQVQEITIINSGTYTVTVSDTNGCSAVDSINVQIFPPVSINLRRDTTIFSGESVILTSVLNGGSGNGSYVWTPTDFLSCSNCQAPTTKPNDTISYFVTYIDDVGCRASDLVNIYIDNEFAFYYPNAFTPNGDSNNDIYYVFGRGVKEVSFSIFNRWGEKIFESNGLSQGWDGKYKGEMQPPGVYVLSATATFFNGQTIRRMGSVTLIH